MTVLARNIADILGIDAGTTSELDLIVQRGLPKEALERTLNQLYSEHGEWKRFQAKVVPIATWKRRRSKLSTIESERTERLARVAAMANETWNGDEEAAREWLKTAHPELGQKTPLDAALTEIGARRVEALLTSLYHGLPA
jgi:putative toxin-antitoxin system antitoxin component (TIGR02293 family)